MHCKKLIPMMLAMALGVVALVGCSVSTSMSLTFDVETGDSINVELDTSEGLKLEEGDGNFVVLDGDQIILEGSFLTEQMYEDWEDVKDDEGVTVLEESEKDGNPYFMLEMIEDGQALDFIVMRIDGSDTAVVVQGYLDAEMNESVFEMLEFSKE